MRSTRESKQPDADEQRQGIEEDGPACPEIDWDGVVTPCLRSNAVSYLCKMQDAGRKMQCTAI